MMGEAGGDREDTAARCKFLMKERSTVRPDGRFVKAHQSWELNRKGSIVGFLLKCMLQ
jgi:hypothetical protein